jgi:hypothetical protein
MLRFSGVTEENVNSILRRTLVIRYKGLFLDRAYLQANLPDGAARGVFPKDPTLKDFLRDKPACLVTLRLIWQYAQSHSAEECRVCLEDYVMGGGDGGLTEASVRSACGLKMRDAGEDLREVQVEAHTEKAAAPDALILADESKVLLAKQCEEVVSCLIAEKRDYCTAAQLKNTKGRRPFQSFTRAEAESVLESLARNNYMRSTTVCLPKLGTANVFLPFLKLAKGLHEVVPGQHDDKLSFFETYDWPNLSAACMAGVRVANQYTLRTALAARHIKIKNRRSGPGVSTKQQRAEAEECAACLANLDQHIEREKHILSSAQEHIAAQDDPEKVKLVSIPRSYRYHSEWRSRRYVIGAGAQSLSRVFRTAVQANVRDFDFHCSMFTIVVQLVDRLSEKQACALLDLPAWRAVAQDRASVCTDRLHCTEQKGKELLIQTACGQQVSVCSELDSDAQTFLRQVSEESRILRWLACSQLPDLWEAVKSGTCGHEKSAWPEATVFSYWWTSAEDYCLSSLLDMVTSVNVDCKHISLHFDGLMLSSDLVRECEKANGDCSFTQLAEAEILRTTGFRIVVKEKVHESFVESIQKFPGRVPAGVDVDTLLTLNKSGNCIPAAFAFLTEAWIVVQTRLQEVCPQNTRAAERACRSYRDWTGVTEKFLHPCFKLPAAHKGDFIIHCTGATAAHCFAVREAMELCQVYHAGQVHEIPREDLLHAIAGAPEASGIVFFLLADAAPSEDAPLDLLDLLAGSNLLTNTFCNGADVQGGAELNEGEVVVANVLRDRLQCEVQQLQDKLKNDAGKTFPSQVCPLCPWRRFEKRCHLATHVAKHHTAQKRYVASGTKQVRILVAIREDDVVRGQSDRSDYLARSAALLRKQVKPPVPANVNAIDKHIRLCMIGSSPQYMSLYAVKRAKFLRRVGNFYYDRAFANAYMCAAVSGCASLRKIAAAFAASATAAGQPMCSLLPEAGHDFWINVLEDLMSGPALTARMSSLLEECHQHQEFRYISIDATVKCMLKVLGQAAFNSSAQARSESAISFEDADYKLLTVRGRTGAVLAMAGIKSEAASKVADELAKHLTDAQRAQVVHVASDNPSPELFATLQKVLPRLQSLSLDATHICMVYQQNMNNKRTPGLRWLGVIMNKFRAIDRSCPAASWGPMYTGAAQLGPTAEEKRTSQMILQQDMPEAQAHSVLKQLEVDCPWKTEVQFLEAIAALCALFSEELSKVSFSGATLHRLLVNLTAPAKVQWLLNDTRQRHTWDAAEAVLLPSGTTSNEALHHEINAWFHETATCPHLRRHRTHGYMAGHVVAASCA